jgi:hypothetical protein
MYGSHKFKNAPAAKRMLAYGVRGDSKYEYMDASDATSID